MKLIGAFLRLVRWPNLFFIVVTQVLFYYCLLVPAMTGVSMPGNSGSLKLDPFFFALLVISSVCIAAAGYIINDYFDLNIDLVNKPDTIVIQKIISRRWAIAWHGLLSAAGVIISGYLSWKLRNPIIVFANLGCVILLWFYSTNFKKQLLVGNIIISLLTAWVILVIYFAEISISRFDEPEYRDAVQSIFKFTIIYSAFAFLISLIRELVKDMEDREGDARYGCRTMPIVWGIPATKYFTTIWVILLFGSIAIVQLYGLLKGWWIGSVYCLATVLVPLITIGWQIQKASAKADYHRISTWIKLIMLAGILSMGFFKWYL
ncbi:geranylgeranylglycerol-phosphate geranylgeranyltransferase [Flavihumibacter petaseus]|uniref:Putative (S)-2,3-Di-O-geranylgeranylglyceryl synthase n=1 Tax=Flavihumibacter petaseus NBRC 106054 TaxID=1220578 RepID=A0A0E9N680_9BACT|nr:geranylgeranylglycerol-phosphate geranylgeranyltransferase [Flavihumibacter petaseus]GAO45334.1 putative (S)-2,3-Di-O-geranylgeranylglyceryl synthase [Flavihumibacter petaseus NBRC 106054]